MKNILNISRVIRHNHIDQMWGESTGQIVPLELEGAKLPLYKVAVYFLLTPRGRNEDG